MNVKSRASDIVGKRRWEDLLNQIDSILSLWLLDTAKNDSIQKTDYEHENNTSDHARKPNKFLLGFDFDGMAQEIRWWGDDEIVPDFTKYNKLSSKDAIHGFLGMKDNYSKPLLPLARLDMANDLSVTSSSSANLILAQQLLSSFLWSFAEHVPY
ncbi:hypothetical protein ONS96_013440 [Cadophora gregata f. sp. sojae]|nr:hypothetical protein ONS96_013440 [Cadophora gregata f. sp. sojae]